MFGIIPIVDIDNLRGLKANNAGSVSTFKASKTCTFANASPSLDLCQYFGHKKLNIFSLHDINT